MDDFRGLSVGDLIYNKYRDGMFIISSFGFENACPAYDYEHPFIRGCEVRLVKNKAVIDADTVTVTISGSHRLSRKEVLEMVMKHIQESTDKNEALQELVGMTSL